jgi:hypothetical protein
MEVEIIKDKVEEKFKRLLLASANGHPVDARAQGVLFGVFITGVSFGAGLNLEMACIADDNALDSDLEVYFGRLDEALNELALKYSCFTIPQ